MIGATELPSKQEEQEGLLHDWDSYVNQEASA